MPSPVEEMQAYYAQRATLYDASMGYDDPTTVASLAPVIASITRQLAARTVLEVACGPGFWTHLASHVATTVTATDCNESTLAEARRKPLDWGCVSLVTADAYDLARVPGDFNAALAVDWLSRVPRSRLHEFLGGLHRRLQPNSRIVFCDQTPGRQSMTGVYDDEGNHLQQRTLPDGSQYRVIKHFRSDAELHELFDMYAGRVDIERFPAIRRVVVGYTLTAP